MNKALRAIKKASNQCRKSITNPITRSARHGIEDEYRSALEECARREYNELNKLYDQAEKEHKDIAAQRKQLEEMLQENAQ